MTDRIVMIFAVVVVVKSVSNIFMSRISCTNPMKPIQRTNQARTSFSSARLLFTLFNAVQISMWHSRHSCARRMFFCTLWLVYSLCIEGKKNPIQYSSSTFIFKMVIMPVLWFMNSLAVLDSNNNVTWLALHLRLINSYTSILKCNTFSPLFFT